MFFVFNKSGIELEQTGIRLVKEKGSGISDIQILGNNKVSNRNVISFDAKYDLAVKPAFSIVELRKGSPAERIGLKIGDVLLYVNYKAAHTFSLQEVIHQFYGEDNKRIRIKVERGGIPLTFVFRLESPIK